MVSALMRGVVRGVTLWSKELTEVFHEPILILSLILGPFLILLVFALGHRAQQPPLRVVLDLPPSVDLPRDVDYWRDRFGASVDVVALASDEEAARAAVVGGRADLAVIVPPDVYTTVSRGQPATIQILYDQTNPAQQAYTQFVAYVLVSELNRDVLTAAVRQAQDDVARVRQSTADLLHQIESMPDDPSGRVSRIRTELARLDQVSGELLSLSPSLVVSPFTWRAISLASFNPGYVAFYSPGVLALLLQHMAITFAALSLVRDRLIGMTEIYKVTPTSTLGVLFGKYTSYGMVSLGVGGALTELMTTFLGVAILGSPVLYWGTLGLLVFTSVGLGLLISLVSASQENAVQLTMLVLLASVFFSGFFLPVTDLKPPATEVYVALPVSHAISALQHIMLSDRLTDFQPLYILAGMGLTLLLANIVLVRRELRQT